MMSVTGVAPLNGWRQGGASHWLQLHHHTFDMGADGQLLHYTDGDLRATVPPEGWDGYMETWPECSHVVNEARHVAGLKRDLAREAYPWDL